MVAHWSWSKLACYLRCPAQFRFRYLLDAPPESTSMALLLGSAIHDAVNLFHARRQTDPIELPDLVASFQAQLTQAVAHQTTPIRFSKTHPDLATNLTLGAAMLQAYVDAAPVHPLEAMEKEYQAPLDDLPLVGFVDRLERHPEGLVVVELKTAARAWSPADAAFSGQLSCYGLLLQHAGHRVRYRVEVLTKTKAPRLVQLTTDRSPADFARVRAQFAHLARAVQAEVFPPNPGPMTCGGCEYRGQCTNRITGT